MQYSCSICSRTTSAATLTVATADSKRYDLVFCATCRTGFLSPMPQADDLHAAYLPGTYRSGSSGRFHAWIEGPIRLSRLLRRNRIRKFVPGGRILDIGCGRGLFLHIMQEDGWDVTGQESSHEAAKAASEAHGVRVLAGDLASHRLPSRSYDVITISHVLEHVSAPSKLLDECKRLIKKGGLLLVAVPNLGSLQARFGGPAWFHLDIPHHLHHFTEQGLVSLLRRGSFRVVKVRRLDWEYNLFGWLQTLLNRSGIRQNFLFEFLKRPELRQRRSTGALLRDSVLTAGLVPVYLPLALVLTVIEAALGRSGTIEILAISEADAAPSPSLNR